MWALGDYHAVAKTVTASLGTRLVGACGVGPGQRVLDVGAGSGNAAIPAAEAGASVVASDLTPELFAAGRREAARRGVELEWIEADAEALPFVDGEFDVVMSCIGAMFAPDHRAVAGELVRVCKPGGTIGMINWPPQGWVAEFFGVFARYAPPPSPGAVPPTSWGSAEHLRELFDGRVSSLEVTTGSMVVDHFAGPLDLREYYKAHFGPTIATYAGLAETPERVSALDRDFLEFAQRTNRGPTGGPAVFDYEYVIVVARTRAE